MLALVLRIDNHVCWFVIQQMPNRAAVLEARMVKQTVNGCRRLPDPRGNLGERGLG